MASDWMLKEIQNTTRPTPSAQPRNVAPMQPKPSPFAAIGKQAVKTGINVATNAMPMIAPLKNLATGGMPKVVADGLAWPSEQVEKFFTGGKGYESKLKDAGVGNKYARAGLAMGGRVVADPLNLVGGAGLIPKVAKIAKVPQIAAKALNVADKIPGVNKVIDAAGALKYGYKTPPQFLRRFEGLQRDLSTATEFASNVATPLKYDKKGKELPKQTQRIIGDVLKVTGGDTNKGITSAEQQLVDQYGPLANKTLKEFTKLAKEQIKLGKDPAIFERLLGKYFGKRMYTSKLDQAPNSTFAQAKTPRLDLSVYQKRLDIPEEIRQKLGEIKEPALGAATAAYAEKKNIAMTKFFRSVAKKYVSRTPQEGYEQLPKSEKLGPISGLYVPKQVKGYIDQVVDAPVNNATEKITRFFKEGKTVLSPKQIARNVVTSQVQAYLNPSGRSDSFKRIPEAINEVRKKGKFYKELKSTGEIGSTFANQEIGRFQDEFAKFGSGVKGWGAKLYDKARRTGSSAQQANEEMAKLQVFINERKAGKSVADAAKAAEESQFNYQKVSPTVQKLRSGKAKLGPLPISIPFLTYPMKAAELVAKTAYKRPERLANIVKTERTVEKISEDDAPNEEYLPEYLKDSVRTPVKSKEGNPYYLNAKYVYPFGNLKEVSPLPFGLTPDPLFSEAAQQFANKDFLTNKPISTAPGVLGVGQRALHAGETFLPTPFRSAVKIAKSTLKNKQYSTSATPGQAAVQELGLPAYEYNEKEGARFASYEKNEKLEEANRQIRKFQKDYKGKLPQPVYDMLLKRFMDVKREIIRPK